MSTPIDIEAQVKVLNSTRTLAIRVPSDLFELIRKAGMLEDIDLTTSLLLIAELRRRNFIK